MRLTRWWHVAAITMAVVLAVAVLLLVSEPWRMLLALGAIALFLVAWAALAPRITCDGGPGAVALTIAVIIASGAGTAATPTFATIQCIAFPIVWVVAGSTRAAVIANVSLALSVGVGFLFSRPLAGSGLIEIAATVALSLAFSLVFGAWMTHVFTLSMQRQELIDELQSTRDKLAAVSRDAGAVAERERLARDIHDTIAQDITGLVMLAEQARHTTDAAGHDELLARLEEGARAALAETRTLVAAGSPASLDAGLAAALTRLAERFSRESAIDVSASHDGSRLERDTEVVALRCTQEALSNVRRHSGASTARVELCDNILTISDDGHGFDAAVPSTGFGLGGMRDRLAHAGGRLEVSSGASGTTLTITLPTPARALPEEVAR